MIQIYIPFCLDSSEAWHLYEFSLNFMQKLCIDVFVNFISLIFTGIGVDKPNPWAFDTAQFDSILKRLKVV